MFYLAQICHDVDEEGRHVQTPSILTRRVVAREDVVVVVKTLAHSTDCDEDVLRGVDALIVRLVAPHVRSTVYEPCAVESQRVAKHAADKVGPEAARGDPRIGLRQRDRRAGARRVEGDHVRLRVTVRQFDRAPGHGAAHRAHDP